MNTNMSLEMKQIRRNASKDFDKEELIIPDIQVEIEAKRASLRPQTADPINVPVFAKRMSMSSKVLNESNNTLNESTLATTLNAGRGSVDLVASTKKSGMNALSAKIQLQNQKKRNLGFLIRLKDKGEIVVLDGQNEDFLNSIDQENEESELPSFFNVQSLEHYINTLKVQKKPRPREILKRPVTTHGPKAMYSNRKLPIHNHHQYIVTKTKGRYRNDLIRSHTPEVDPRVKTPFKHY